MEIPPVMETETIRLLLYLNPAMVFLIFHKRGIHLAQVTTTCRVLFDMMA